MAAYGENFQYNNITLAAPTTTTVKAGSGVLHSIAINTPAATGTITIFDSLSGAGTKIGTITSTGTIPAVLIFDVLFKTGLTLTTATAAQDITVTFK